MKRLDPQHAVLAILLAVCCLLGQARPAFAQEEERADDPKALDEAMARVEKVLGAYSSADQREWRVPTKFEYKSKPKPSEAEVLSVFDGLLVVGCPFREPESFGFDQVWQWKRRVFDLTEGGEKTLTRTQRSHNVSRYTLSKKSGVWLVNGTILTNGVHDIIGKPALEGTVRWHPDGFEFVGSMGVDEYYAAGGKFVLGISHGSMRYMRRGDRLLIKTRLQPYHLAKDREGNVLAIPDLNRPFGSVFEQEYQSEPLAD